ncbi:hypothetical protein N0725_04925 [Pseudomonas aeruginosa]|uniref:hypothetical protein n=1 Tax=Pseudomonas aeruginosa TaxID=287 RepID=UPI00044822A3|nr:hypothetical protein [Pseudomonas aeruginosa]ELK3486121.1 hypothetical protein [Pseudomonas aeruginosa]EME9750176.1 hypothetical protein [Pseudomonas aeruginosa]ETU74233.1 hypothetical protein Q095_04685 [Pseudomonas aeruginosa PS50]MBG4583274.1 hypothetical protein [Pseudomonas aeruginosa]MBH9070840.1 hypothetical protein [Pseudomonas aeruginosa]
MTAFLKSLMGKNDLVSKVLKRHSSKKAVSAFARDLSTESAEIINARFAKVKRVASR